LMMLKMFIKKVRRDCGRGAGIALKFFFGNLAQGF